MRKFRKSLIVALAALMMLGLSMVAYAGPDLTPIVQDINDPSLELIEDNGQNYEETVIYVNPLLRASSQYKTSYDMTGGVYTKQTWNTSNAPTFEVSVIPETYDGASKDVNMGIYLEKKSGLSWKVVDEDSVKITEGGTVTLKGDGGGSYRLYFRNWSGFRTTGKIVINATWTD